MERTLSILGMKFNFLLLLLFSVPAVAAPKYVDKARTILIQSSASCQAILGEALSPEKKIADALNSLFADNDEAKRRQQCFEYVVSDWNGHFSTFRDNLDHMVVYAADRPAIKKLSAELTVIDSKLRCFNRYMEGSNNYHAYKAENESKCPQWITKAEADELYNFKNEVHKKLDFEYNKEYYYPNIIKKILSQVVEEEKLDRQLYSIVVEDFAKNFSVFPEIYKNEEKLGRLSYCFLPETLSNSEREAKKSLEFYCKGKWFNSAEKNKLEEELKSDWKNLKEISKEWLLQKEAVSDSYSRRKLFAIFHAELKKQKDKFNLKEFCDQQEKNAIRDSKFESHVNEVRIKKFNSRQEWEMALKGGLSEAEISSIAAYTGSYYKIINQAIWQKSTTEQTLYYKDLLDSALEKAPGPFMEPVLRMTTLPPAVLSQHELGSIVTYDAYTSTSKKKSWQWQGKHKFIIYSGKNGKDVSSISSHPSEEEVLFRSGTRFKVISRKETGGGSIEFVMAEVNEKGEVIAKIPQ